MQLLEGQTLRELISTVAAGKPPLPLEKLLDLAIQITDGLAAAHQKGIIHRDIKPANIFVTSQGQAKILDFGLAKLAPVVTGIPASAELDYHVELTPESLEENTPRLPFDLSLSLTGVAIGTAGYMSPEQVRGEDLDARTDLFSFGVVLYEMATGTLPFRGESSGVIFKTIQDATPIPATRLVPDLPSELERIINKCLEKDRSLRYQHASDVGTDLQRLKRDSVSGITVALPGSKNVRANRWIWITLAGATLATTSIIAWQRRPTTPHR
jgi:serine/threonine protein kinase